MSVSCDAVLFDLFDTLVLFDRDRLPEIHVNGRTMRSTAGRLHEALRPFAPAVGFGEFVAALSWSWQEAERVRTTTHREVAAPERFGILFGRLGLDAAVLGEEALPLLLATHMQELSKAVVFPAHHRGLLHELRRRHRLGVVSNFDYAPTAHFILEREGIAELFTTVVVSDEVGWRKPKAIIFERALERLGMASERALFVGDRADIDVAGAHGAGMKAVWVNRSREALPPGAPPPEFEIHDLGELVAILSL